MNREEEIAEIKQKMNNYSKYTVSPSGLNAFRFSPNGFIRYKEREDERTEKYFDFGSAFHTYILEKKEFTNRYVISDTPPMEGMMGDFIRTFFTEFSNAEDNNFEGFNKDKSYKIAYAASGFKLKIEKVIENFENEDGDEKKAVNMNYFNLLRDNRGKGVLTSKEYESIILMSSRILDHKVASKLFIDDHNRNCEYLNEFDYEWKTKKFRAHGIMDRVIIDHDCKTVILVDLKSSKYAAEKSFTKTCKMYDYDLQLSFYRLGMLKYMEEKDMKDYKLISYIVASQKTLDYDCVVYSIKDEDIIKASIIIMKDLDDLSWHFESDNWDYPKSYYEGNGIVELNLNEKEQ